jgi:hypothetical protein
MSEPLPESKCPAPEDCYCGWHECYHCDEGWIESDDWQDFGEEIQCGMCNGHGGWKCPEFVEDEPIEIAKEHKP